MGVGKYSPTVSNSYSIDQNWWEKNGGGVGNGLDQDSHYDDDGYDEYGYDKNDVDRAGNTENHYLSSYASISNEHEDSIDYILYDNVSHEWQSIFILDRKNQMKSLEKDADFQRDIQMKLELKKIIDEATELLKNTNQRIENKLQGK